MFTPNVGTADRIVRLVLGVVLMAAPLVAGASLANPWLSWGLPIVGIVLAATAFLSFCPIYKVLGLSTRRKEAS